MEAIKKAIEDLITSVNNMTATDTLEANKTAVLDQIHKITKSITDKVNNSNSVIESMNADLVKAKKERDEANELLNNNRQDSHSNNKSATERYNEFIGGLK